MSKKPEMFACEICTVWVCEICGAKDFARPLDSDKCRRCYYDKGGVFELVEHIKGSADRPHLHQTYPPDPTVEKNAREIVRRLVGKNGTSWISDLLIELDIVNEIDVVHNLESIGVLGLSDHDNKCHLVLLAEQIDRVFPDPDRRAYVDDATINAICERFDRERNSRIIY